MDNPDAADRSKIAAMDRFNFSLEGLVHYVKPPPIKSFKSGVTTRVFEDKVYGYFWYETTEYTEDSTEQDYITTHALFSNGVEGGGSRRMGLHVFYNDASGKALLTSITGVKVSDPLFSSSGAEEEYRTDVRQLPHGTLAKIKNVGLFWSIDLDPFAIEKIPTKDITIFTF